MSNNEKAFHGMGPLQGLAAFCSHHRGDEPQREDRFGRMFPDLPPNYTDPAILLKIGAPGGPMDAKADTSESERPLHNSGIPFLVWILYYPCAG